MRRIIILANAVFAFAASGAFAASLMERIPASLDGRACINVRNVVDSGITSRVLEMPELQEGKARIDQLKAVVGLDPMRDIDRICYARNMAGGDEAALLIVEGRFDPNRIVNLLAMGSKNYETTTVASQTVSTWKDGSQDRRYLAFVPPNFAVMGFSRQPLEELLGGAPIVGGAISGNVAVEENDALAWFHLASAGTKALKSQAPALQHLQSLRGVATMQNKNLAVQLTAKVDEDRFANELKNLVEGMLAFGRLQNEEKKLAELSNRVSVTTGETSDTVIVRAEVPLDELFKFAEQHTGHRKQVRVAEDADSRDEMREKRARMAEKRAKLEVERAKLEAEKAKLDLEAKQLERELERDDKEKRKGRTND